MSWIHELSIEDSHLSRLIKSDLHNLISIPTGSGRNNALDGLRGVAVLLTFLVHFNGLYLVSFRGGSPDVIPFAAWHDPFDKVLFWLYHSHHGVYIFFVLSGFLICRIVMRAGSFNYGTFLKRRVFRIYPAFLLALALCLAISVFLFGSPVPNAGAILGNMVFLNALPAFGVPPLIFNNVTWSLFFEACFYLIFPLVAITARRRGGPPAMFLILGGLATAYLPLAFGLYTEFFLLFFAGALIGLLDARQAEMIDRQIPDELLIVLYLFLTTSFTFGLIDVARFLLLFSAVGALIVLKAAYGTGLISRVLSWNPLVWLGGVSYSFYLLHCVPLFLIINYAPLRWMQAGPVHAGVLGALCLSGAVVLAALSFALTERTFFSHARPTPGLAAKDQKSIEKSMSSESRQGDVDLV